MVIHIFLYGWIFSRVEGRNISFSICFHWKSKYWVVCICYIDVWVFIIKANQKIYQLLWNPTNLWIISQLDCNSELNIQQHRLSNKVEWFIELLKIKCQQTNIFTSKQTILRNLLGNILMTNLITFVSSNTCP